ncbi:MAG: hypothetical protein HC850_10285 [Rhodomicrobium sp.]|nr:hypothetical protein [Rhodomicrobium sp.]
MSLMFSTHVNAVDSFKSSQFLSFSQEGQASYISTSVGMTGLIAARNDKKHADCIDQWYFSDMNHGNQEIIAAMRKYPDYHPQAVIIAVLQKFCGTFTYANR